MRFLDVHLRRLLTTAVPMLALYSSIAVADPAVDLLSFSRGAVPVAVEDAAKTGVGMDQALRAIDGDPGGFTLTPKPGNGSTGLALVYSLPARTVFSSFEIPNVLETPSPSQTFVRTVTVFGSDAGAQGPFEELARVTLATHAERGLTTRFPASARKAVRWIRLSFDGGIKIERDRTFLEFSEIIGHGEQETLPASTAFSGHWKGRGVTIALKQDGIRVEGCYDDDGALIGTVSGNLLHATGLSKRAGIPSAFVLTVGPDGELFGLRSTNGAPFRILSGTPASTPRSACLERPVAPLGCGAVVHGIHFDLDSATIRPESEPILDDLYDGLKSSSASRIVVVGHTSSEGSDTYNQALSERRARAVGVAIVARGIDATRVAAEGLGEKQPIADNATDAGRSLNRRVEIVCR